MRFRLLLVSLILLLLVGAGYAYVATGRAHGEVRRRLLVAAQRQLGREVRIAALRGHPLRGVVLEDVAVARRGRLADGALVTVDRVVVRFRPAALLVDLLRGRGVLPSIGEITLVRPNLSLEISRAGRWNVFELFQPRGRATGPPAPTPLVIIQDGRGTVVDASGPPWPFRATFARANGQADLRRWPIIPLQVELVSLRGERPTPLEVRGKYVVGAEMLDIDVTGGAAPLTQWGPYLVRVSSLVFEGGTGELDLHVLSMRWGGRRVLDYRGRVTLTQAAATLLPQRARLRQIQGDLRVDNLRLQSDGLRLLLDGSPLRVRGEMTLTAGRRLDLAVSSPRLDLATVQRLLFPGGSVRLAGQTGADVRITGSWAYPQVDGVIGDARGTINRQPVAVSSAGLRLVGNMLMFTDFHVAAEGARFAGELRLTLGSGDLLVAVEGQDLLPEMLPRAGLALTLPVRGRLTGALALARGEGDVVAETAAVMGAGQVGRIRVDYLRAGGWFRDGELAFPYLIAGRDAMVVNASGVVSPRGELALDAAGTDLDLAAVARDAGLTARVQGTADAAGQITGTVGQPVFTGTVAAGRGKLATLTFDGAEGPLRLSRSELKTPGLRLREGNGAYLVAGSVRWTRPSSLALTVEAQEIPAASLARAASIPLAIEGQVSGRLTVAGTTARPAAAGRLVLRDGQIEGQRLDEASARFRWRDDTLTLDEAQARVRESAITAHGTIDRQGSLRLEFAARGFDLRHLTLFSTPAVQPAGRVDLEGRIGGSAARPTVAAALASRDLVLNGQRFDRATGAVRWAGGRLFVEPLTLSQDGGTFTVRGSLGFGGDLAFDLRGEAVGARLATLLAVARVRPSFALDGELDGTVTVQGSSARPAVTVAVGLRRGRLGDHPIDQAEARLSYRDDVLTVGRLSARSGGGEIVAQGRVPLRGDSQLEVGGSDLNLDLLRPLLGIDRRLDGTLTFTTQISGPWRDPEVGLSLDVRRGGINGLRFDSLVANAFYRDGQLHVEQALLSENGHRVKGVGTIPFSPWRGTLAEGRPMRFDISLVQADLSLLALLLPPVEDATGRLEGQITFSGTPRRPEMTGRLSVRNGRIKLRSVTTWFEEVQADVGFNLDRIALNAFSARLGGGTLSAAGTLAVANFRPTQIERLTVRARDARLEVKPLFAGDVDADLTLSGPLTAADRLPEVSGQAWLKNGDLVVLGGAGGRGWRGPNLRLRDLRLASGPNLAVHLGRLRVVIKEGSALLAGGTLRQPTLDGDLFADRGTVTVFGRTFQLREGQARFLPQLGLKPILSLQAEAEVPGEQGAPVHVFIEARQVFPEELADRLVLRSDPSLSRQEIVTLLAGQTEVNGQPVVDLQAALRAELSRAFFGQVEETIARALGLSEFTIQYDFTRRLQLRIGRLLVRDLYLRLTTVFEEPTRFIWALEWRFARNLNLSFTVDNVGRADALLLYTIRF